MTDAAANAVHFLNTDTYLVDASIQVGSKPGAMEMTQDGSLLFVSLHGGSSVAVVDLSEQTLLSPIAVPGTPEEIALGSNDRLYVSIRDDSVTTATSYFETRWPLEDGNVPVFRTADLLTAGTVNVQWNPVAVALCPSPERILVAHSNIALNATTTTRHGQGTGDLHAFDGTTYVETSRYHLRNRVKALGITCGPDGRIYLILGADAGTAIGGIAP